MKSGVGPYVYCLNSYVFNSNYIFGASLSRMRRRPRRWYFLDPWHWPQHDKQSEPQPCSAQRCAFGTKGLRAATCAAQNQNNQQTAVSVSHGDAWSGAALPGKILVLKSKKTTFLGASRMGCSVRQEQQSDKP